jgi:hypothetical protein
VAVEVSIDDHGMIDVDQIFRHVPTGRRGTLPACIRVDEAGVDGNAFYTDKTFRHAAADHGFEELAEAEQEENTTLRAVKAAVHQIAPDILLRSLRRARRSFRQEYTGGSD